MNECGEILLIKNSNYTVGNRIPASSAVPQPTAPTRVLD